MTTRAPPSNREWEEKSKDTGGEKESTAKKKKKQTKTKRKEGRNS
jgi:hypothetical protein